jgi:hypothetical protein
MKKQITLLSIAALFLFGNWGFLGHRTIHQLAIYGLPDPLQGFFYANSEYMIRHSVRADVRRKDDPTEATKHFIDLDVALLKNKKIPGQWNDAKGMFSEDTLRKYGTVPWEIIHNYRLLVEAFRQKDKENILFYAADLGHYVADAHVPLHTTENYDGQLSNQNGLHSLWESTVLEIELNNYNLYQQRTVRYVSNPEKTIWACIRQSQRMLPLVFKAEIEASEGFSDEQKFKIQVRNGVKTKRFSGDFAKAYSLKLGSTVNNRLLEATATVSDFWYSAWIDAGKPDLSSLYGNTEQAKLSEELTAWRNNELIKLKLLKARQNTNSTE